MPGLTFDLDLPPDSPALSDAQHAAGDNVESSVFRQTAALGHLGLEDRPPADPGAGSGAAARAMPASEEQNEARGVLSQLVGREVRPEDVMLLQAAVEHIRQLPMTASQKADVLNQLLTRLGDPSAAIAAVRPAAHGPARGSGAMPADLAHPLSPAAGQDAPAAAGRGDKGKRKATSAPAEQEPASKRRETGDIGDGSSSEEEEAAALQSALQASRHDQGPADPAAAGSSRRAGPPGPGEDSLAGIQHIDKLRQIFPEEKLLEASRTPIRKSQYQNVVERLGTEDLGSKERAAKIAEIADELNLKKPTVALIADSLSYPPRDGAFSPLGRRLTEAGQQQIQERIEQGAWKQPVAIAFGMDAAKSLSKILEGTYPIAKQKRHYTDLIGEVYKHHLNSNPDASVPAVMEAYDLPKGLVEKARSFSRTDLPPDDPFEPDGSALTPAGRAWVLAQAREPEVTPTDIVRRLAVGKTDNMKAKKLVDEVLNPEPGEAEG